MNQIYGETKEENEAIIEASLKYHFEDPKGLFYKLGVDYESLDPKYKESLKTLTRKYILQVDSEDIRLPEKENEQFWEMDKSYPSDHIVLATRKDLQKVMNFWHPEEYASNGCPSDIILDKTVPIKDMILTCMDYNPYNEPDIPSFELNVRIFLFDDYEVRVDQLKKSETLGAIQVGGIELSYTPFYKNKNEKSICFVLCVTNAANIIYANSIAYKNCKKEKVRDQSIRMIHQSASEILEIWYGIQLSLLNPITEQVILKSKSHPINERKVKVGKGVKKSKIIYVKKYFIKANDIDNVIEEHRKNNMKCPLWYVIGHWREYKKDKKHIWIKGYWKGPDRKKMDNLSEENSIEIRQRLVDMRVIEK